MFLTFTLPIYLHSLLANPDCHITEECPRLPNMEATDISKETVAKITQVSTNCRMVHKK